MNKIIKILQKKIFNKEFNRSAESLYERNTLNSYSLINKNRYNGNTTALKIIPNDLCEFVCNLSSLQNIKTNKNTVKRTKCNSNLICFIIQKLWYK